MVVEWSGGRHGATRYENSAGPMSIQALMDLRAKTGYYAICFLQELVYVLGTRAL